MTNSAVRSLPLKLYSLAPFDRGAKARWLLAEVGAKVTTHWLDREKKESESPAYLKLNPMGRVPVLTIGDEPMFESGAICAHLADHYMDRGMAPALDSADRGKYQQWMYFASSTLDVFQTRIMVIEDIPEGEVHTAKLTALQNEIRDAMTALDITLSKGSFLVGNRLTAADLCVSYHLYWLPLWPELKLVMSDFPKVMAYIERMKNLPSATQADVFSFKG